MFMVAMVIAVLAWVALVAFIGCDSYNCNFRCFALVVAISNSHTIVLACMCVVASILALLY